MFPDLIALLLLVSTSMIMRQEILVMIRTIFDGVYV